MSIFPFDSDATFSASEFHTDLRCEFPAPSFYIMDLDLPSTQRHQEPHAFSEFIYEHKAMEIGRGIVHCGDQRMAYINHFVPSSTAAGIFLHLPSGRVG